MKRLFCFLTTISQHQIKEAQLKTETGKILTVGWYTVSLTVPKPFLILNFTIFCLWHSLQFTILYFYTYLPPLNFLYLLLWSLYVLQLYVFAFYFKSIIVVGSIQWNTFRICAGKTK